MEQSVALTENLNTYHYMCTYIHTYIHTYMHTAVCIDLAMTKQKALESKFNLWYLESKALFTQCTWL